MRNRLHLLITSLAVVVGVAAAVGTAAPSSVSGAIELAGSTQRSAGLKYGSAAAFTTTVSGKLANNSMVYITVVCSQNGTIVYQWSAGTDFAFPLVDQDGQGLDWNSKLPASCIGALVYRVENGKNVTITYLDQTTFDVAAG